MSEKKKNESLNVCDKTLVYTYIIWARLLVILDFYLTLINAYIILYIPAFQV